MKKIGPHTITGEILSKRVLKNRLRYILETWPTNLLVFDNAYSGPIELANPGCILQIALTCDDSLTSAFGRLTDADPEGLHRIIDANDQKYNKRRLLSAAIEAL